MSADALPRPALGHLAARPRNRQDMDTRPRNVGRQRPRGQGTARTRPGGHGTVGARPRGQGTAAAARPRNGHGISEKIERRGVSPPLDTTLPTRGNRIKASAFMLGWRKAGRQQRTSLYDSVVKRRDDSHAESPTVPPHPLFFRMNFDVSWWQIQNSAKIYIGGKGLSKGWRTNRGSMATVGKRMLGTSRRPPSA